MRPRPTELPVSEHFRLARLAEGVYAAVATEGGAAFSNAGIVGLGDRTLVFDTFDSPKAAADLRYAAELLTGDRVGYATISHAHPDHWLGNQAFAAHTAIVSTVGTREAMAGLAEEIRGAQADPSEWQQELRGAEERLAAETDEARRALVHRQVVRLRREIDELPTLRLRLPDVEFESRLVFRGTKRRAELLTDGPGHTASDSYLVLPEDHIVFLGDLGFFAGQPFMAQANPVAWKARLEAFSQSDHEVFVPGHGPVGTKADLALEHRYITVLEERLREVIGTGGTVDDALAIWLPAPFDEWQAREERRWETNVRAGYQRLSAGSPSECCATGP